MFVPNSLKTQLISIKNGLISSNGVCRQDIQRICSAHYDLGLQVDSALLNIPVSNYKSNVGLKSVIDFIDLQLSSKVTDALSSNVGVINRLLTSNIKDLKSACKDLDKSIQDTILGYKYVCNTDPNEYFVNLFSNKQTFMDFVKRLNVEESSNIIKGIVEERETSIVQHASIADVILNDAVEIIKFEKTNHLRTYKEQYPEIDFTISSLTIGKIAFLYDTIKDYSSDEFYRLAEMITQHKHQELVDSLSNLEEINDSYKNYLSNFTLTFSTIAWQYSKYVKDKNTNCNKNKD